jgi:gamma-glutamyltranspeptidase/glutathione hydrolase
MANRRQFLRTTAAGVAAVGVVQNPARADGPPGTWQSPLGEVEIARFGRKRGAAGTKGMVVCSHPLATRAGANVLRAGGNACDAALCASVTQTIVEPHMTTITGVLSMLYYDAASGKTSYVNGSINVPLAGLPGFSGADLRTGRGVGVPGFWAGFEAALARHGSKSRRELLDPAIRLAREGFRIHDFLYGEMFVQLDSIGLTAAGRRIFMPEGSLLPAGSLLKQVEAADTLERLAAEGNQYYYHGEFARKFSEVVKEAGGVITPEDFAKYEVRWQEPARGTYRGYDIAASPPPDNGGTHIIEALNMIELLDLAKWGPPTDSPDTLYYFTRINNEVMTAGARQTDPTSHPVPLELILSKRYAAMRLDLLKMGDAGEPAKPSPSPGSNHVTVVDGKGNVATILHSVMALPWSNGLFVGGFGIAASGGHFLRVMPKPGRRASAYVAPNIIFKAGKPVLASGSPSVGLIANILQNTTNHLDFGIPLEASVHRPRFGGSSSGIPGSNYIEVDLDEKVRKAAVARGVSFHAVSPWHFMNGAFEGIAIAANGTMTACGDPRRAGHAEAV